MPFDYQPTLISDLLTLRPLQADDFDALYHCASDPLIWAVHPAKNRHEKPVFEPYFQMLLKTQSTMVAIDNQTNEIIGCSRYYTSAEYPNDLSIGFTFLTRAYWGGDTNFEFKRLMVGHIFSYATSAWFHIGTDNIRSQKATTKLGAKLIRKETLNLGTGAAEYFCYELTKSDWKAIVDQRY